MDLTPACLPLSSLSRLHEHKFLSLSLSQLHSLLHVLHCLFSLTHLCTPALSHSHALSLSPRFTLSPTTALFSFHFYHPWQVRAVFSVLISRLSLTGHFPYLDCIWIGWFSIYHISLSTFSLHTICLSHVYHAATLLHISHLYICNLISLFSSLSYLLSSYIYCYLNIFLSVYGFCRDIFCASHVLLRFCRTVFHFLRSRASLPPFLRCISRAALSLVAGISLFLTHWTFSGLLPAPLSLFTHLYIFSHACRFMHLLSPFVAAHHFFSLSSALYLSPLLIKRALHCTAFFLFALLLYLPAGFSSSGSHLFSPGLQDFLAALRAYVSLFLFSSHIALYASSLSLTRLRSLLPLWV